MKTLNRRDSKRLIKRYRNFKDISSISYGTVRDYCDSADNIRWLSSINGDMKDMQRPWMVKAILGNLPLGSRLLEVGGGEPLVAGLLAEVGYDVVVVDPYDGSGFGPVDFERFVKRYPHVHLLRTYFNQNIDVLAAEAFDCIFSISVLEHVHEPLLRDLFHGVDFFLKLGGFSIHAIDHVVQGQGADFHAEMIKRVIQYQNKIAGSQTFDINDQYEALMDALKEDVDTYYLSAESHNMWRGQMAYEEFPFRKCANIQMVVKKQNQIIV